MNNKILKNLVYEYIDDHLDPVKNFNLGFEYYTQGHGALAFAYFLRCAELSEDDNLSYQCLILSSHCLDKQGLRTHSARGLLLHAISLLPKRPEAHYHLIRLLEINGDYQECYTQTSIALSLCDFEDNDIFPLSEYPGKWAILFERSVSGWFIGRCDEAREITKHLWFDMITDQTHSQLISNNMDLMGLNKFLHTHYDSNMFDRFKFKFDGLETIEKNYSQAYQDMFTLSVLQGKRNGTYLEIGSADPYYGSNTALLEEFEWNGVSVEIDKELVERFKNARSNEVICSDATTLDYNEILSRISDENNVVDYLQLDCDPPEITYQVTKMIPFDKYKFRVITFEHDRWYSGDHIYNESRKFFTDLGYVRLVPNIAPDNRQDYEDWYVHPELVYPEVIEKMKIAQGKIHKSEDYMIETKNKKGYGDFS